MAKIQIKHLGPITNLELDMKQFNLLIGEQATGKSTICKAVYFFRQVKEQLIDYLYSVAIDGKPEQGFPKALSVKSKESFVQLFGYTWNLPLNLNIRYDYKDNIYSYVYLKNRDNRNYISLNYSKQMHVEIVKLEQQMAEYHSELSGVDSLSGFVSKERLRVHQEIETAVNALLGDSMKTYYIPAGRGLLSLMTNQLTRIDFDFIDPINRTFAQFIEGMRPRFDMGVSGLHKYFPIDKRKFDVAHVSGQIMSSMRGEYYYLNGKEYLETLDSKEKIPINFTSSGQQEALWLLNRLYVLMLREEKAFVIIEEPEAHVYPKWQRGILDFIVEFMNLTDSTVILTTHSPYFLTGTNVLFCGGRIIETMHGLKANVEKTLGKYIYIKPSQMQGYKLEKQNGTTVAKSLIDEFGDELRTELIDDVSTEINKNYTELFYLEEENGTTDTERT